MPVPTSIPHERPLKIPIRSKNCKRDDASLPRALDDAVPSCAEPCVSAYLHQYWIPDLCRNSTDFGCLCGTYSSTGYTLGEIALACVSSGCGQTSSQQASDLYNVCESQSTAVTATHTVLTVLVSATPSPTSDTSSRSSSQRGSSASSLSQSSRTFSTVASPSSSNLIPAVTSVSAPAPTSTISGSSSGSELTNAQAIGVTVGAFGGVGLAVALLFCCICVRRKKARKPVEEKKKKRHSYDFACATTPRFSPFQSRYGDVRGPLGGFHQRRAELSGHPHGHDQDRLYPGVAANKRRSRSVSPESVGSCRSVSQLLPDRPPTSPKTVSRTTRPFSSDTVFEEDNTPWSPGLQKPVPLQLHFNYGRTVPSGERPKMVPIRPIAPPRRSSTSNKSLNLSIEIPGKDQQIPPPRPSRRPDGTGMSPEAVSGTVRQNDTSHSHPNFSTSASSAISYLPRYYTSNDSRTPVIPLKSPSRPRIVQNQWRSPPPTKPLPRAPKAARGSRASETSFESIDPDEKTPPEERDRQLTSDEASPISGLRYPKIPRSANQAIPRSPPTSPIKRTPPNAINALTRSETLASRRGAGAASDLRLGLRQSPHHQTPTHKGRDSLLSYETPARKPTGVRTNQGAYVTPPPRSTSRAYRKDTSQPQAAVTSPPRSDPRLTLWPAPEPRLTPTKRGNEYFINVG